MNQNANQTQIPPDFKILSVEHLQSEAEKRLSNFDQFDVHFLEVVVNAMNSSQDNAIRDAAVKVLQTIKDQQNSWQLVEPILKHSSVHDTIFFALLLLEGMVQKNWRALSLEDKQFLHKFVKEISQKMLNQPESDENAANCIRKLSSITKEIAKKEYPLNWPTFIDEFSDPSQITSENGIINNLRVIKYFAEDIFQFSDGKIQHNALNNIKENLIKDFEKVHNLALQILPNFTNKDIITETIQCLTAFNQHIDVRYFTDTELIDAICTSNHLKDFHYSASVLQFLTKITSRSSKDEALTMKISKIFVHVIATVKEILPFSIDLKNAYKVMDETEKDFINSLGNFISRTITLNQDFFAFNEMNEPLHDALTYMLMISHCKDGTNFKFYAEFWQGLSHPYTNSYYSDIFSLLVYGMAENMAKPEEVLIIQDSAGNIVRERLKNTQEIKKFQLMKALLKTLVEKDEETVMKILVELLKKQTGTWGAPNDADEEETSLLYGSNKNWTYAQINSISWAIGCISNKMYMEREAHFFVLVLKELLNMNDVLNLPDHKAVIASDIMYIVGQYPKFLSSNWNFCTTVLKKLFEFMSESFTGVKDMSCDTFAKIVDNCKFQFARSRSREKPLSELPYLFTIIEETAETIENLENHQKLNFYSSLAKILESHLALVSTGQEPQSDFNPYQKIIQPHQNIILEAMDSINTGIEQAIKEVLLSKKIMQEISFNINVLAVVGEEAGFPIDVLSQTIGAFELLYTQSTNLLSISADSNYELRNAIPWLKQLKKDILSYLKKVISGTSSSVDQMAAVSVYESLLRVILKDYQKSAPSNKEPEILSVLEVFLSKSISDRYVHTIIEAVLVSTLEMIKNNFADFPDHRLYIFKVIYQLVKTNFLSLLQLSEKDFRLIIDTVVYALNHNLSYILEIGLDILQLMIINLNSIEDKAQIFYRFFYKFILEHLLILITDSAFQTYLTKHARIIGTFVLNVNKGFIYVDLDPTLADSQAIENLSQMDDPEKQKTIIQKNIQTMQTMIGSFVKEKYSNLSDNDIEIFVKGLIAYDQNHKKLLNHICDFVIDVKENRSKEYVDPYSQARITEMEEAFSAKQTSN